MLRRAPAFQVALLRPLRRLPLPRRHFSLTHAAASLAAAVVTARAVHLRDVQGTTSDAARDASQGSSSAPSEFDAAARSDGGTQARHGTAAAAAHAGPSTPAWTVEQVSALLRRYEALCTHVPLQSSPACLTMGRAPAPLLPPLSPDPEAGDAAALEWSSRAPARPHQRVREDAVEEARALMDRLAQEPQRLAALPRRQRLRLVTEVCRLGYVVGLHSRCCALYVDAVLRTHVGGGSDEETTQHAVRRVAGDGDAGPPQGVAVPDFVVDAAGEMADLATLQRCLARASPRSGAAAAPAGGVGTATAASPAPRMGDAVSSEWLVALHVYAQCVRVLLRRGWRSAQSHRHSHEEPPTASASGRCVEWGDDTRAGAGPASPGAAAQSTALARTEAGHADVQQPQPWHDFAARVLRRLRVRDADAVDFLATSLRRAAYRLADTDGDWAAAQAVVYAQCFRYWLREETAPAALPTLAPLPVSAFGHARSRRPGRVPRAADSARTQEQQQPVHAPPVPVRLTVPALLALLRTAVVARQRDIADWAALYVDVCLEEWTSMPALPAEAASALTLTEPLTAPSLPHLETLLVWYMRHLHLSGQRPRAVRWLHRLRRRSTVTTAPAIAKAVATLPVAREAARLAGDARDAELAMWCLQQCLSDAATPALAAGHADIFACLCAYARCGLPNFDMVLHSLRANELLAPSPEEDLFVCLLHARRSVHWRSELERCVAPYVVRHGGASGSATAAVSVTLSLRMPPGDGLHPSATLPSYTSAAGTDEGGPGAAHHAAAALSSVFTSRVVHQILLLLQEGEHPEFMAYYRAMLHSAGQRVSPQERARWAVVALVWTAQLRGNAPLDDAVYVAREVEQLTCLHHAETPAASAAAAAEPWRTLRRQWAAVYQQYPASVWQRAAAAASKGGNEEGEEGQGGGSARRLRCTPTAAMLAMPPVASRFARRRRLLPVAAIPSVQLLRHSLRAAGAAEARAWVSTEVEPVIRAPSPAPADLDAWVDFIARVPHSQAQDW